MPIGELVGADGFEMRRPLLEAGADRRAHFFASTLAHPTRGEVAIQTDYVPWADAKGHVRGIMVLLQDVTEQRIAERALRESEARFRRIANSAPAMMWVTRRDQVRDFVNEAYADFACGPGCDHEQARTLDWRARIHPDDVERIVAESIAGEATARRSRSRAATSGTTASGGGCAACRSRASGPTASWSGSSGWRATSRWPSRPSSTSGARSTRATKELLT